MSRQSHDIRTARLSYPSVDTVPVLDLLGVDALLGSNCLHGLPVSDIVGQS